MKITAELFEQTHSASITIIDQASHDDILKYHGQARLSIGLAGGVWWAIINDVNSSLDGQTTQR